MQSSSLFTSEKEGLLHAYTHKKRALFKWCVKGVGKESITEQHRQKQREGKERKKTNVKNNFKGELESKTETETKLTDHET